VASIRFEWDETKNLANQRKHGVSFEDATEIFDDPLYIARQDRTVEGEQRWQTFGLAKGVLLLMAAHSVGETQEDGFTFEIIRIISARYATPQERRNYEDENG
jgi:uncharacterized protein